MTNRKSLKEIITAAVQAELPNLATDKTIPVEELLMRWWASGRQEGLRLTEWGDMNFRTAEIEFYQCDFKLREGSSHHAYLLELNKKVKCPYYIGVTKEQGKKAQTFMRLYDSKIAMMIELYGSITNYLDSVKIRK